jgi:hypothetical protein
MNLSLEPNFAFRFREFLNLNLNLNLAFSSVQFRFEPDIRTGLEHRYRWHSIDIPSNRIEGNRCMLKIIE